MIVNKTQRQYTSYTTKCTCEKQERHRKEENRKRVMQKNINSTVSYILAHYEISMLKNELNLNVDSGQFVEEHHVVYQVGMR